MPTCAAEYRAAVRGRSARATGQTSRELATRIACRGCVSRETGMERRCRRGCTSPCAAPSSPSADRRREPPSRPIVPGPAARGGTAGAGPGVECAGLPPGGGPQIPARADSRRTSSTAPLVSAATLLPLRVAFRRLVSRETTPRARSPHATSRRPQHAQPGAGARGPATAGQPREAASSAAPVALRQADWTAPSMGSAPAPALRTPCFT